MNRQYSLDLVYHYEMKCPSVMWINQNLSNDRPNKIKLNLYLGFNYTLNEIPVTSNVSQIKIKVILELLWNRTLSGTYAANCLSKILDP